MDQFKSLVCRAAVEGNTLIGYAAIYDTPTTRQRDFAGAESIARGAFDAILDNDVVALVNHDMSQLIGRSSSGTLRLGSDAKGLTFAIDLPDTQVGRDVRTLVARGDLQGMSFTAALGEMDKTATGVVHKTFSRLVDVSVVTNPAYLETQVALRSAAERSLRGQLASIRHRVLTAERD